MARNLLVMVRQYGERSGGFRTREIVPLAIYKYVLAIINVASFLLYKISGLTDKGARGRVNGGWLH
jgi:hypothetical protein